MNSRHEVTQLIGRNRIRNSISSMKISEYFGQNTFKEETMRPVIAPGTFKAFKNWQEKGKRITKEQADEIADAIKEWAVTRGATAYSHWFQPMTGQTAEKHDSFLNISVSGEAMEKFSGDKLIRGEPDASSFPSGGLRTTFEARGYTAWDPSSPAFITETGYSKTLCIPSIYISYNGDALDKKLPLLKSEKAISSAALELLRLFGDKSTKTVFSTCGPEQEFFLIDSLYYKLRNDLQLTGRTLAGAPSPKDQQMEDQYFGSIKERTLNYMHDVTREACKLGIPVATKHNEVAPHQYEIAPIFEKSNIAADHNQLLMDIMRKTAKRHNLECLLHEKPFAGINGSGKHLNWSLSDNNGNNLLNPGDTPEKNIRFLTILVSVIRAVFFHSDLIRASVASAGNEHRLGANEAPPAIISIFLGKQLAKIIQDIKTTKIGSVSRKDIINTGLDHLPSWVRDNTDRNRTSPFAFTGDKFEFRALGSSMNISIPLTVINTAVADSIKILSKKIKKSMKNKSFEKAVFSVLKSTISECETILFEGDNYSEEWKNEAKIRCLKNTPSTPQALKAFTNEASFELFERHHVFSRQEIKARYNIWVDIYIKLIEIEARTLKEMVCTQILPAAYDFQIEIGNNLEILKDFYNDEAMAMPIEALNDRKELFSSVTKNIYYIRKHIQRLSDMLKSTSKLGHLKHADYLFSDVKPHMKHIRKHVDDLELMLPDDLWLLPKYREMLFIM